MITTLIASLILAQAPGPVAFDLLPFDPAKLDGLERVEIKVAEDGRSVTYSGIALATILERGKKNSATMPALRAISDSVLLVRGSDGYQAAVSAAAVAMDPKGERYLLALARDGKPLEKGQGPVRLIVPGDSKHVRWVREVSTIRLVKLDKVVGP
jgi:hypothetical protein